MGQCKSCCNRSARDIPPEIPSRSQHPTSARAHISSGESDERVERNEPAVGLDDVQPVLIDAGETRQATVPHIIRQGSKPSRYTKWKLKRRHSKYRSFNIPEVSLADLQRSMTDRASDDVGASDTNVATVNHAHSDSSGDFPPRIADIINNKRSPLDYLRSTSEMPDTPSPQTAQSLHLTRSISASEEKFSRSSQHSST
eukprot:966176_1